MTAEAASCVNSTMLTAEAVLAKAKVKDLKMVKKLNFWASNLTDVSILKQMPNIEILTLSVNNIRTLEFFKDCLNLCELYIRNNDISDIHEIFYLKELKNLKILWLSDNKCAMETNSYDYRMTVIRNLPLLEKLDNTNVTQEELDASVRKGKLIEQPPVPNQTSSLNYSVDSVVYKRQIDQLIMPLTDDLKCMSTSNINNKCDDELNSMLLDSVDPTLIEDDNEQGTLLIAKSDINFRSENTSNNNLDTSSSVELFDETDNCKIKQQNDLKIINSQMSNASSTTQIEMSKEPNKSSFDMSSIVNLKAELLKKQDEYRLKKLSQTRNETNEYETHKTDTTWGKKRKIESTKADEAEKRDAKTNDQSDTETETQDQLFERSKKMLESKAKYYDEVVSGKKIAADEDDELFLVDFVTKVDAEKKLTKAKEGLNLKKEIAENDYNEEMRSKWEQESRENLEKLNVRYQDIKFNEIRNMGVGNYQFSRDEEERQKQMDFFKQIEKEIKSNRITNEIYKLKREQKLLVRLSKIKQRLLIKHGYLADQIKEMCTYDKDIEEIDEEIKKLEIIENNPELIKTETEENQKSSDEFNKPVKRVILDREWDKPKLKEKMWEKHVEKLRRERNKLYAPPKIYEKNKGRQNAKKTRVKQYESAADSYDIPIPGE